MATNESAQPRDPVLCVDFGSTFTKALLVDPETGVVYASTEKPTTVDTDVLDGLRACVDELSKVDSRASEAEILACSSAGGGLRIAVLGNEELVTAEAGRRVALSSGGKVVHVGWGPLDEARFTSLVASSPDVLLLVGGTDGGNSEVIVHNARRLREVGWTLPVVVAGNRGARGAVVEELAAAGAPYVVAENVVPKIGVLAPDSARAAIRTMFLSHVIGGKHLSASEEFVQMVKGATPDIVLTGVEMLSRGLGVEQPGVGDVVVVDVGGATTDVHSVVELDPEDAELGREVVATTPVTRTVEGDLGMRWSALNTVEAAGLVELAAAAIRRRDTPGFLPVTEEEMIEDEAIAQAAIGLALRRHAGRSTVVVSPEGRVVERSGKDLREVDLLVGSGGVLRHGRPGVAERVFTDSRGEDIPGGWQLPRKAALVIDRDYILAAVGLLATDHPEGALRLARTL